MQPFCQNPALSRSLESELESAVKSGELKLSSKNLKDFPRHGERFNLSDTTLAGKNTLHYCLWVKLWQGLEITIHYIPLVNFVLLSSISSFMLSCTVELQVF